MAAPSDAAVAMVLARLRILRGAASEAAHVLETTGRARGPAGAAQVALAARACEIDGESAETTMARWREAAEASGQSGALEALARAYRRGARHGGAAGRPTSGWARRRTSTRGAARPTSRSRDRWRSRPTTPTAAEAAFNAAADRDPDDLLVHAGRVMLYRKHQQVGRAGGGAQGAHRAGALQGGAGAAAPAAGARRRRAPRRSEDGARALREGARAACPTTSPRCTRSRGCSARAESGRAPSSCASTRPRARRGRARRRCSARSATSTRSG